MSIDRVSGNNSHAKMFEPTDTRCDTVQNFDRKFSSGKRNLRLSTGSSRFLALIDVYFSRKRKFLDDEVSPRRKIAERRRSGGAGLQASFLEFFGLRCRARLRARSLARERRGIALHDDAFLHEALGVYRSRSRTAGRHLREPPGVPVNFGSLSPVRRALRSGTSCFPNTLPPSPTLCSRSLRSHRCFLAPQRVTSINVVMRL